VLNALAQVASKLRGELGEELATVQKFDVPLPDATTSSLEALKAYSLAAKARPENGNEAALGYAQRAVELDPSFALGYSSLGTDYHGMGQVGRAAAYYKKAFELREHASEREKLSIGATYYRNVTGELDKAARGYQELIASYSRSAFLNSVGIIYGAQGRHESSIEALRQGQASLRIPFKFMETSETSCSRCSAWMKPGRR
jgi:tetratricopeptide (TPR) repeat protein